MCIAPGKYSLTKGHKASGQLLSTQGHTGTSPYRADTTVCPSEKHGNRRPQNKVSDAASELCKVNLLAATTATQTRTHAYVHTHIACHWGRKRHNTGGEGSPRERRWSPPNTAREKSDKRRKQLVKGPVFDSIPVVSSLWCFKDLREEETGDKGAYAF